MVREFWNASQPQPARDWREMKAINIAATVPVTEAEGPGKRFAVWVQGCPMRCAGCCNPQYIPFTSDQAKTTSPADLAAEILKHAREIEGVTFIGGEPFSQADGLAEVARIIREADLSVMIFSGFTKAELDDTSHEAYEGRQSLLSQTDLLVDGRYDRDQHVTNRRWIGSANQQVHFLSDRYRHLENDWPSDANTIEIRFKNGELTINGFPDADITSRSAGLLRKKS